MKAVHLTDYKVRILDTTSGTAAMTRVLIDFSDGDRLWTTVGASTNIIEASWIALSDSVEYFIVTDTEKHHVEIHMPELVAGMTSMAGPALGEGAACCVLRAVATHATRNTHRQTKQLHIRGLEMLNETTNLDYDACAGAAGVGSLCAGDAQRRTRR